MNENENKIIDDMINESEELHEHDHEHGIETISVDLEDENGNIIKCEIVDGFEFEGEEYAVVENPEEETVYLFKVVGDDEVGELVLPDDEEFEKARKFYEELIESEM